MKRYILLLAVALMAVVSCSTPRLVSNQLNLQAEWIGRSHADIVRTFGAPTREVSDGADGQILVYESFYTTHSTDEFMGDFTTTSTEHRDFKEFYIRANGRCYDVRTNETVEDGRQFNPIATLWLVATIGIFATPFLF